MIIAGKLPISPAWRQKIIGCLNKRNPKGARQRLEIHQWLFPHLPGIMHFNPQLAAEIQRLRHAHRCNTAEALGWFLAAYLKKRRRLQTLGRLFVFSMDPVKSHQLLLAGKDPTGLLMAAVKKTFQDYAKHSLPGEELMYVMSIYHRALTNMRDTTGHKATPLPKVRVHVLLFNRTSQGRRYCLSNQYSRNIRNLDNFLELYQQNVKTMVYSRSGITGNLAALNPLIAYYAWLAVNDFQKAPQFASPLQGIQYCIERYQHYIGLDYTGYRQHFGRLVARLKRLREGGDKMLENYRQSSLGIITQFAEIAQERLIKVVDRLEKANEPKLSQQSLKEFSCRSLGINLQMIAEYFELALNETVREKKCPAWLKTLHDAAQSPSVWESLICQLRQGLRSTDTLSSISRGNPNLLQPIHAAAPPQAPALR